MKISRRAFTLLEIFLTISVLAMLGGLLAFKAKDLLATYGFRQDISKLSGRLEIAKRLSLSYQADVEVVFSPISDYIVCELRSDEPALKHHSVFCKPLVCKKIHKIRFVERKESCDGVQSVLFSGSGWVFPLGDLEMSSHRQDKFMQKLGLSLQEIKAK